MGVVNIDTFSGQFRPHMCRQIMLLGRKQLIQRCQSGILLRRDQRFREDCMLEVEGGGIS